MIQKILATIILVTIIISCSTSPERLVVKGKVTGIDGKIPPMAHINITKPDQSIYKPANFVQVDDGGNFKIQLPAGSYWKVTCTAVNHTPLTFPLFIDENSKEIEFEIKLPANTYKEDLSEIQIMGEWNDWSFANANKMIEKDGKFYFQIPSSAQTLAYQIINITKFDRSVNGTQSDSYRYDQDGDYESVLKVENGLFKVEFDPGQIRQSGAVSEPIILFSDANGTQRAMTTIFLNTIKNKNAYREQARTAAEKGEFPLAFSGLQTLKDEYYHLMSKGESELLRKFSAIYLADLTYFGLQPDTAVYQEIARLLPMTDTLWTIKPMLLAEVYINAFGQDKAMDLLYPELSKLADRVTQAYAIVAQGFYAREKDDFPRQMEMHKILLYRFSDITELRPLIDDLDPRQNIRRGKTIPAFNFPVIGSKKNISSKSIPGKYHLLFFWNTYGKESLTEMPGLHQMYEKYPRSLFEIIAINMDPFKKNIVKFRKEKWAMPWINVHAPQHQKSFLALDFSIKYIPKMILVDPQGKIVAYDYELRGNMLEKTLDKIFSSEPVL